MDENVIQPSEPDAAIYAGAMKVAFVGTIAGDPEAKYSRDKGTPYVSGLAARAARGDNPAFVRLTAFSSHARDELLAAARGAIVEVKGDLDLQLWTPSNSDGQPKISASVIVSSLTEMEMRPKPRPAADISKSPSGDSNDPDKIPF
jgi:hypothetical protein